MGSPDQALATQLRNIETRTGRPLDALHAQLRASGLEKHGQLRDLLKRELGMGHGDANLVVHTYLQGGAPATAEPGAAADAVATLYAGPKAGLRPIHDRLMDAVHGFGPVEVAPRKAYVSLRRKKQFATIGPATRTRVEVGLNMRGVEPTDRLRALPPGGMCQYRIDVTDAAGVDAELIGWLRTAWQAAG